jgi:type I restriction enzyme R subunit
VNTFSTIEGLPTYACAHCGQSVDATGTEDSDSDRVALAVLGDAALRMITHELVEAVRKSVRIDWTIKKPVRAQIQVMVKRILKKCG